MEVDHRPPYREPLLWDPRRKPDVIDRLPADARRRLLALRRKAANAAATARSIGQQRKEQYFELEALRSKVNKFVSDNVSGWYGGARKFAEELAKPEAERSEYFRRGMEDERARAAAAALRDLVAAEEEHRRAAENAALQSDRGRPARLLLTAVESWLDDVSTVTLTAAAVVPDVKLGKGESYHDAVERRRRKLCELESRKTAAELAPWPSSVAKAAVRASLAGLPKPDALRLVEHRGKSGGVDFPHQRVRGLDQTVSVLDALALVTFILGPETVEAKLDALIDEASDDANALTDEQRTKKLTQISDEMLLVQREEVALIEIAEKSGIDIAFRENTDPRAVLFVDGPAPRE